MAVFRCRDVVMAVGLGNEFRLNVEMLDDHNARGGRAGERTTTSAVRMIDLDRGIAVTKSGNIYVWEPRS